MRLIDADKLKKAIMFKEDVAYETWNELYDSVLEEIDNAPTVEPEKVLVANVTFDKDELEQLIRDRVIEPIKKGELVLQTDKRPQGKWIRKVDRVGFVYHICSECGAEIELEDCSDNKFCFNCGAEMQKGEEGEQKAEEEQVQQDLSEEP